VLVVGSFVADGELLADLQERKDFAILQAATAAEAARVLDGGRVRVVVAAPALPTAEVTELVALLARSPVSLLIVRHRQADEPAGWMRPRVGVLRCPLLPGALSRSVEVVLGLSPPQGGRP
jgi:hypothetical protein